MAANGSINSNKKQLIVSALCKHLSLDPKKIVCDAEESDLKTLYSNILKASGKDSSSALCDEVMKWIEFAESFIADSKACFDVLSKFNEELTPKAVLLGNGLRPSEADVVVFSTVHSSVIGLPKAHQEKLPHVVRWMDYIQSIEDFKELFENVSVEKARFEPPRKEGKGATQEKKESIETETVGKDKKKKATGDKDATQEMKKSSETEASEKDKELSVSLLNIQVGLIRKAWKHPSADSLLVEEIDIGEAKVRQVVSGLAKYCNPDELTNRRVVLITNVKPGKLRDVMSEGLVLCASNEDHTVVEPLLPPGGAKPGERVSFSGIDGKPEDVLNPKKKQLEKITPHLFTDEKGVATFKGIPFMTSAGPCTSSILKASIK
ncbi:aminoacyl tRNA synthase complex-interacting multifunctional protein 1 isoform X3 [Mangifera indica]|uniref:aminoacyl tRNA synthase complex-interacting multifunctional protein 1 isoform X3 n=1 Tax=Mangifera indica TaxID=29780 RepID=UPI001CFBD3DA|nr:aminoacyl tRNA synthase complex-interacting multifunctional protein 1 isoform X3 [Mangifera indica]